MGEAAQNLESTVRETVTKGERVEPAAPANTDTPPAQKDNRDDVKNELTKELRKTLRKRDREASKADAPASPKDPKAPPKPPAKEPQKREAPPAEKDPKATAPKDAKKAEPGKDSKPLAEGEQAAEGDEPDEHKELKAQRRSFAKFQRKKEAEYASRESQLTVREQRVQARESTLFEGIKRDPLRALRELGVDVRKTLLEYVDEENEDPRDKRLRELGEKAETAEKTAKELAEERARERQQQAFARIGNTLYDAWQKFEPDEHPYLRSLYEPAELVNIARTVVLKHFKSTGQQLAPARVFAYLEDVEREEDERKQVARGRHQTIGSKTEPESREQVPPARAASPERRERASDVTNRATRIQTSREDSGPEDRESVRSRLIRMAREATRR